MPNVLTEANLRKELSAIYSGDVLKRSKVLRRANIDSFLEINREGLKYDLLEHRILLYKTLCGEKIHIQLPGKESSESRKKPMKKDFRPKLECSDGRFMPDASFELIWQTLYEKGVERKYVLDIVAAMFFRVGYMYEYPQTTENYKCDAIRIDGRINDIIPQSDVLLTWYFLDLDNAVWESLNDRVGKMKISEGLEVSFEAFIKFVDLLVQNEDCKYFCKKVLDAEKKDYSLKNGRTATCDANLVMLDYLSGRITFSSLVNRFQRSRGVPSFKKSDYPKVTNEIIEYRK